MNKLHQALIFLSVICFASSTNAEYFKSGNIYYNVNGTDAEVVSDWENFVPTYYSGDIVIPATISYKGGTANVIAIASGAFNSCSEPLTVSLPEGLRSIAQDAFYNCTGLTSIVIPSSTTDIGSGAFFGCENIREVYCRSAIPPRASDDTFDDFTYQNATLYIPQDAPDADEEGSYEKAYCWRNFKTIKRKDMASVDNIPYDEQYGYVYDISGREKAQGLLNDIIPQLGNGIYIVNSGSRSYKIRIQ